MNIWFCPVRIRLRGAKFTPTRDKEVTYVIAEGPAHAAVYSRVDNGLNDVDTNDIPRYSHTEGTQPNGHPTGEEHGGHDKQHQRCLRFLRLFAARCYPMRCGLHFAGRHATVSGSGRKRCRGLNGTVRFRLPVAALLPTGVVVAMIGRVQQRLLAAKPQQKFPGEQRVHDENNERAETEM